MRILVVEDTEDSRVYLTDFLESSGHRVKTANNGREGLELLNKEPFDLIITDVLMPEMDGFELCKSIMQDINLSKIPLIIYTATYTDERDIKLGLSLGAKRYLLKPFEPVKLLQEIENVVAENHSDEIEDLENLTLQHTEVLSRKLQKKLNELMEEKAHSETLRRQLETMTDTVPLLIAEINSDYRYVYINATYEKWYGKSKEQIIGKHISELLMPETLRRIEDKLEYAFKGNQVCFELEHSFPDGTRRYIQAQFTPIYDNGSKTVTHIYSTVADNTERYLAELEQQRLQRHLQQSQKLELIGQLTGGVAHDFNNLLASILGFASLCQMQLDDKPDEIMRGYVDHIVEAGERGKSVIAQLLAFCRGTGKEANIVEVNSAIQKIISLLKPTITSTVSIHKDLYEGNLLTLINSVQLDQILMNLCINARDAIPDHGAIAVTTDVLTFDKAVCSSCMEELDDSFVVITVRDTGKGIDKVSQERIFEPFFTTKEAGMGTGMGLSMVHGIVHEFGGHIIVESEPGQGAAFKVLLPVIDEVSTTTPEAVHEEHLEN